MNLKLIAYSKKDIAGSNIVKVLDEEYDIGKSKISSFDDFLIYLEDMNEAADLLIVASRHRSESGMPTLTCHVTGNFKKAEFGGEDHSLAFAPALYNRKALLLLNEYSKKLDYRVSLEVTHHGPTSLKCPLLFVEVGSSEQQWNDMKACQAAANTIYDLIKSEPEVKPVAIGFGGPHYAPNFSKIIEHVAFGHIMPKYAVEQLDKQMVEQMIAKTVPKPELAVIDWKGFRGEEKRKVIALLEEVGLKWKKTSEF